MPRLLILFLSFSLLVKSFAATGFHEADVDQDSRIALGEIEIYWNTTLGTLSTSQRKQSAQWQQADHIWRSGETYVSQAGLPEPYCFLPVSSTPQASVSNRFARCLSIVEILAPMAPGGTATAEFRPFGGDEWFALDVSFDQATGRVSALVPYLPTSWMAANTRRIEVRATLDGTIYQCGEIELRPIDRSSFNFEIYFDQIVDVIENMAGTQGIDAQAAVSALEAGGTVSDEANVFAAAILSAEFQKAILDELKNGSSDAGQAIFEINEELFVLNFSAEDRKQLARTAANSPFTPASVASLRFAPPLVSNSLNPNGSAGCAPINDRVDLQLASIERCRLDGKKSLTDQIKDELGLDDVVDNAGEKLSEYGEQAQEKFVEGLGRTAGIFTFAANASYELYEFKEEWNKAQLPVRLTKFDYEVEDNEVSARGYLLEDSPFENGNCKVAGLKVYAHAESRGFDSAKFLIDKIPSASDSLPGQLTGNPLVGDIATGLADSAQAQVLDAAHAGLKEDLQFAPCRWPENSSARGIELEFEENWTMENVSGSAIEVDRPGSRFFKASNIGKGPLRVKMVVDGRRLCLDPFTGFFSYEVRPIRVKFNPVAYTVEDVDDSKTFMVTLEDSYETDEARWYFADKNGNWLEGLQESDGTVTLDVISGALTTSDTKTHTLTINPPDDLDLYPLTVEVVSEAEGCLRPKLRGFRYGQAKVHYQAKAFVISPNRTCFPVDSVQVLSAEPVDGVDELDVEWEITEGDATIVKTSPTTANLILGSDPSADIEVKATGNDTFETYVYFSSGPCFELVNLNALYPDSLHLNPTVGSTAFSKSALLFWGDTDATSGFDFSSIQNPGPNADFNVNLVYAFGATRATVIDTGARSQPENSFFAEVEQDGYFWTLFNFDKPGIVDYSYQESPGGTYVTELNPVTGSNDNFGTPAGPVEMTISADGTEVTVKVAHSGRGDYFEAGSNVSAFWTVLGGSKVDETVEDETYFLTATFPVTEQSPTVQIRLVGSVRVSDENYSLDYAGITQFRKVQIRGKNTYVFSKMNEDPRLCGNWAGRLNLSFDYVTDGCCGAIELFGNQEYQGSARQNTASSATLLTGNDPLATGSFVNFNYSTEEEVPYCSEVRRLERENPDPPIPPHRPAPTPDPPDSDTPPEISDNFKSTTVNDPENPALPQPDFPRTTAPGGQQGAIGIANTTRFKYPVLFTDFANPSGDFYPNGIELGTFDGSNGSYISKEEFVASSALQYLADSGFSIVSYGSISGQTGDGLLIERNSGGFRYVDFWERDPVDGLLTGRTLIDDAGSFRALGMGDFDGDGKTDLAGVDTAGFVGNGAFLLRKGSDTGFAANTVIYANAPGDLLRAATGIPGTTNSFLAVSGASDGKLGLIRLDGNGNVLNREEFPDTEGTFARAFADFDDDSIPDLIIHETLATTFTVRFLNADGTTKSTRTFTIPANHQLPGFPLF